MTTATATAAPPLYVASVISVIVPTHDRRDALAHTLAGLAAQEPPPDGFEVIVVDNGCTDGTPAFLRALAGGQGGVIRSLREPAPGPAAARNAGVAAARGDVLLFLGDDMEPAASDLVGRHAALHGARPESEYGVLGRVRWSDRQPVTPLMRWLESGSQFAFASMRPGPVSSAKHLYTAHVSMKKELFDMVGGFDRRFPYAAVEDMELGLRLERVGLELHYVPDLLVLHEHPIALEPSLERMRRVGRSAALFNRIHPEIRHPHLDRPDGVRWRALRGALPCVRPLARRRVPTWLRERAWHALHLAAYAEGFRDGPASMSTTAMVR